MRPLAILSALLLTACAASYPPPDARWLATRAPDGTAVATIQQGLFTRGFRETTRFRILDDRLWDASTLQWQYVRPLRGQPRGETQCWSRPYDLIVKDGNRVVCFSFDAEGLVTWSEAFLPEVGVL